MSSDLEGLVETITSSAEKGKLATLEDTATEDPSSFLEAWQTAIDQAAEKGEGDTVLELFAFRCGTLADWDDEFSLDRFSDPVRADLVSALRNGHRDMVLKALEENVAPHDWDELYALAKRDKEMRQTIETTYESVEDQSWEDFHGSSARDEVEDDSSDEEE